MAGVGLGHQHLFFVVMRAKEQIYAFAEKQQFREEIILSFRQSEIIEENN